MLLLIAGRGHAKSEYYSAVLPASMLGENPSLRFVHITSTDALATMYSRRLQRVVTSENYRQVYPAMPGRGNKWTEREWSLDVPGQRDPTWRCTGRGGSITGGRADVIIVDDVVTYENARTEGERRRTLEWFQQTLVPMLVPKTGKLLVIGTRYHELDLYASLMAGGMEALIYPAEDALGNILWPERFSREALDARRRPPLGSEASYRMQYLCEAVAAMGEVFRAEWFPVEERLPELRALYWIWDTAVSEKTAADFTAGVLGGLGVDGNIHLVDAQRGQWAPTEAKERVIQAYRRAQATWGRRLQGILVEDTKEGRVLQAWIREAAPEIPVILISHEGVDKYTRAAKALPYCEAGQIRLLQGAWNSGLIAELVSFTPDGRHAHDDWTDAVVYLVAYLLGLTFRENLPPVVIPAQPAFGVARY
jgi:predicted phage terminase large subunit-like protein